jgi:hypothetical protein
MLNSHNRLESCLIWGAIALLLALVLWSLLGLPAPYAVWTGFLASSAADEISRFQIFLGTVAGFAILATALLYNGHRERAQFRQERAAHARGLAHALSFEMSDRRNIADARVSQLLRHLTSIERARAPVADEATATLNDRPGAAPRCEDMALYQLDHADLASLGDNATIAVNLVRAALRRIDLKAGALREDSAAGAQTRSVLGELVDAYAALAVLCGSSQSLFETLQRYGERTADMREPPTFPSPQRIAAHIQSLTTVPDTCKD